MKRDADYPKIIYVQRFGEACAVAVFAARHMSPQYAADTAREAAHIAHKAGYLDSPSRLSPETIRESWRPVAREANRV